MSKLRMKSFELPSWRDTPSEDSVGEGEDQGCDRQHGQKCESETLNKSLVITPIRKHRVFYDSR